MPYRGPNDPSLPSNVRKMPAQKRSQWVNVWNSTYSRCKNEGKSAEVCESQAFRNANGVAKDAAEQPNDLNSMAKAFLSNLGVQFAHGEQGDAADAPPMDIADVCAIPATGDAERWPLFFERSFAEAPEWVPFLPKPGQYTHPVWGKIVMTSERVQRFVSQFNAGVYQQGMDGRPLVPIDAEHESKLGGAFGWMTEMRQNADGSADGRVYWTDRGRTALQNDRFKFFSPEWYERWKDPLTEKVYTDVAAGGAICTRPFFKTNTGGQGLRPLVAHEDTLRIASEAFAGDGEPSFTFEELTPDPKPQDDPAGDPPAGGPADDQDEGAEDEPEAAPPQQQPTQSAKEGPVAQNQPKSITLTEEQWNSVQTQLTALTERVQTAETKNEELTEKLTAAQEEAKKAGEAHMQVQATMRAKRFTDIALGRGGPNDGGTPWVGPPEQHVRMLTILATVDPEKGEEGEAFQAYVEQQNAAAEQARVGRLFSEVGAGGAKAVPGSARATVEEKAKALRATDPKLTIEEATVQVLAAEPELYAQYESEKKGV